jgi:predicted MFS family arabinose efflux permease
MVDEEIALEVTHIVPQYHVYGIRWIQLLVYFLASFANSIHGMTFAPIESQTKQFYNISTTEVNALAIVCSFVYTVGTILSIWLSRKYSLRIIMIIGSILNLGVFIRVLSLIKPDQGYSALMIGQILPAISAPFFLNSASLFAARWFAPSQRDVATAIGSMANPLGLAMGTLFPSLIINDTNASSKEFFILLIIEAGFTLLTTLLIIIIFRSNPPTPPSSSEEHHQTINIKEDLIKLLTNFHYLTLLFGFSLGVAIFNSITTLLYQLIAPSGYTSNHAGIFGAILIVSGLLNSFIVGFIMDKTHAYQSILKILVIGACASAIFFILILRPNELYPLALSISFMGFFILPLLPVSFECAVECTYPIRSEWSTGLLMCVGNSLGVIFSFISQYLLTLPSTYKLGHIFTPTSIFMLAVFILSSVSLLTYRGPYLRLESEKQANSIPINN